MWFLLMAVMFVVAALVHGALAKATTEKRIELVLVYLLAGYHGIVMLAVAVYALVAGEQAAAHLGTPAGNLFQQFFGFAYMGMAVASILCIWLRGAYLVAPVVCWCVFFFGATYVHMADYHARGALLHSHVHIVLAHAVVPALMLGLSIWLWARWRGASSLADRT